jgi:rhamnosyltransferase
MPDQFADNLPSIAVCLAAYNGVRWLGEQLDSILDQHDVKVTVFVSVDQSSDGTEKWVDERASNDTRIVVLPHGLRFGGAAPNFLRLLREVDFTPFDYVSLADQDDIWLPNKLARAHKVLKRSGAAAYSSDVTAFWPDGRQALIKKSYPQAEWDFLFEAAGPGCTYVLRRELVRQVQRLVTEHASEAAGVGLHDWFIYAYARANNYPWVIDDHSEMLYRQHGGNQVGVNNGWKAFAYRARKVTGGWALAQAELISHLVGIADAPQVRSWLFNGKSGILALALHANQCRRRRRDKLLFGLSCLVVWIAPQPVPKDSLAAST